jgi:hypothetical protein
MGHWKDTFEAELRTGEAARLNGNEGRARVCARRAAGIAVGAYYRQRGIIDPGPSAYNRLRYLSEIEDAPPVVREIASHFLVRIDTDHHLPIEADLLAEARQLAVMLMGDSL